MESSNNGWIKAFHPSGIQVTLPIPFGTPQAMFAYVGDYLAAGFLVAAPGLEAGEEKAMIRWVLRGEKGDGVPWVLLYVDHDRMTHSILKCYLNDDDAIVAFEMASGLKLKGMPLYEGDNKPERGKNPKVDAKYLVEAKKPFGVVFKENPKYDPTEAEAARLKGDVYKVAKRVFLRWENQGQAEKPAEKPSEPAPTGAVAPVSTFLMNWKEWVQSDPNLGDVNLGIKGLLEDFKAGKVTKEDKNAAWRMIDKHCADAGFVFDRDIMAFVRPENQ